MSASESSSAESHFVIVTIVKTLRVVYFCRFADFAVDSANEYYYGQYKGTLPDGMTLQNCSSWRFDGSKFSIIPQALTPDKDTLLLLQNRAGLILLLNQKIDDIRTLHIGKNVGSEYILTAKFLEATVYEEGRETESNYPYLKYLSKLNGTTCKVEAERIIQHRKTLDQTMFMTERLREQFLHVISSSQSSAHLQEIRVLLLDHALPGLLKEAGRPVLQQQNGV